MNRAIKVSVSAAAIGLTLAGTAQVMAYGIDPGIIPPNLFEGDTLEKGDVIVRGGIVTVMPSGDSGAVSGLPDGVNNARVEVENNSQLSLTAVYMLRDKIGLEVLAATPFKHDIVGKGDLEGVDVGETRHLPPTVSLQYYFGEKNAWFKPYVGVGINWTLFFSEKVDGGLLNTLNTLPTVAGLGGVRSADLELDSSLGLAAQVGVDMHLIDNWHLNTALWYVDIDTEAELKTDLGTTHKVDVEVDPWVFNVALAYKF
ncbi:MAG: OmpW/AlkL family protein [Candidatus Electronema sp. V4]|uniref:OmpW/AlkL family protein n=1 Tax=Candidatus Electronema sp. V4 TaxID=3454756 RepID=UPI0040557EBC